MIQKSRPIIIIFTLTVSLWLLPVLSRPESIPFHPNAEFSDLLVSHWPNTYFMRSELSNSGTLPLWNPQILSGAPLAADPLFGLWYPPNWIALVLPITLAFNLLFWFHLFWAGLGLYNFMRAEGYSTSSAVVAGLAFCGTPKLIGHIALGHLGLVAAVAWTPWVLLAAHKTAQGMVQRTPRLAARAAVLGGLIGLNFLIDPRWVIPLGGLTAAYVGWFLSRRKVFVKGRTIGAAAVVLAFALGTASALAIPLLEFSSRSTRSTMSIEEAGAISLPMQDLLGIILPPFHGWPETLVYVGISVLGLALVAVLARAARWRFWGAIFVLSVLIALGSQTPLNEVLVRLIPGFRYLRVPARFLFISSFALAILSGMGLEGILHNGIAGSTLRRVRLGISAYGGIVLLLGVAVIVGTESSAGLLMVLSAFAALGLLFLLNSSAISRKRYPMLWGILIVAELFIVNRSLLVSRPLEDVFQKSFNLPQEVSLTFASQRFFSPSYSIPQHNAALEQIQLADGVNPLQMRSYWDYMAEAVEFDSETYSVTLPPFTDGIPSSPREGDLDTDKLGMLNIGTIISAYPIENQGLEYLGQENGNYTYTNPDLRPRAWVEPFSSGASSDWGEVETIQLGSNQIKLTAIGPGLLVLSELDYPGWEAFIDGDKVPIKTYQAILRSVELDSGLHEIDFIFRPMSVYFGVGISLFSLMILVVLSRKP